MKQRFYTLSHMIATALQMQCSCKQNDIISTLQRDDFLLHLAYHEKSGRLIMLTDVALVPVHDKAIFYQDVLALNNEYSETKGFSYALDAEQGLVVFQCAFDFANTTDTDIFTTMDSFFDELMTAYENIENIKIRLAQS